MKRLLLGAIALSFTTNVWATEPAENTSPLDVSRFSLDGDYRVRSENYGKTDFASDRTDTVLRIRPKLTWRAASDMSVVVQIEAAKALGQPYYSGASTTTNSLVVTSSQSNGDTPVTFHQAYGNYHPFDWLELMAGRQVMMYGDELVIGHSNWTNVARSFDAIRLRVKYGFGVSDLFTSKVEDLNVYTGTGGLGDEDFHGLYNSFHLPEFFVNDADLYFFDLHNATQVGVAPTTLIVSGIRLKSTVGSFDYRVEGTTERGFNTPSGNQINPEVGYTFGFWRKPRLSVEYFYASNDYNQLFPSAHSWLGYEDIFGRRNIEGYGVHASSSVMDKMTAKIDYYGFSRADTTRAVYQTNGTTAIGSGAKSTSSSLGSEVDLTVQYATNDRVMWTAGYSHFFSGAYFKDQFGSINPDFYFLQLEANF